MKRFMAKAILIASAMFISVLFGMQQANEGIHKMKGYDDQGLKGALTLQEDGGEIEASILGNEVSSHDLEKKKEELEELKAYNFFSSLGKKIAEIVSGTTENMIDYFVSLIQDHV
ncbi:YqxA family protein [Bacillus benzoevorans]|nr:YqxA family protein [Bacillus benzoevorans]